LSWRVKTADVLLKITVPKRTGRKRKRGSQDAFLPGNDADGTGPETVLRCLKDNVEKYDVTPVGFIEETFRFRGEFMSRVEMA